VVDDDPHQVALLEKFMATDFAVTSATSPKQALELLEGSDFEVVLSDLMMPSMTGVELLARARRIRPDTRRVVTSAFADAADVLSAIDAGDVHYYLAKPVSPRDLKQWLLSFVPQIAALRCAVIAADRAAVGAIADDATLDVRSVPSLRDSGDADLVLYVAPYSVRSFEDELVDAAMRDKAVMVALPAAAVADAAGYLAAGADDVVWLPVRGQELALRFQTWRSKREASREAQRVRLEVISQGPTPDVIGRSEPMRRVFHQIHRVAPTAASVMFLGETGTGKEMMARALHALSHRRDAPFVAVNLQAMPETLVEGELFGHEKGAFTGAQTARKGLLESVEGGTLFLDEIGDLAPAIQVKLLRVLENRTFERLGSSASRKADFRLVCATHRDLEQLVGEGRFREDLFYRINVVRIELPPLRERGDDIRELALHFVERYQETFGLSGIRLGDRAIRALLRHHWPGNIRELKHLIERAVAISQNDTVIEDDILWLRPPRSSFWGKVEDFLQTGRGLNEVLADIERSILVDTMQRCGSNQAAAAKKLKIPRQTLQSRLKKYGL
jgi:DNA-binding NtrC family response regulator